MRLQRRGCGRGQAGRLTCPLWPPKHETLSMTAGLRVLEKEELGSHAQLTTEGTWWVKNTARQVTKTLQASSSGMEWEVGAGIY